MFIPLDVYICMTLGFDFIFNVSSCSLIQLQDYALRQMERIQKETYMDYVYNVDV